MQNVLYKFPARPPRPDERVVLAEWLATAGDIALAYISSRQTDDPTLKHRIIVIMKAGEEPSHIVFAPAGRDIWIVLKKVQRTRFGRYKTLRAALNSIRPVLVEDVAAASSADHLKLE